MKHCDDYKFWETILCHAILAGIGHANARRQPLSEEALLDHLRQTFGAFGHRRGHAKYLRTVYGAAFNGIRLSERALTSTLTR